MSGIFWIGVIILTGYMVFVGVLYMFQSRMVFYPSREIFATPENIGLEFDEITFATEEGLKLNGWYIPADRSDITVLFQHGNAGNISGRLGTIEQLHKLGLNLFIYDYRGYGRSKGNPSEKGIYSDSKAAWRYLVEERKVSSDKIVIIGRSLGGAVAAWLATQVSAAGLVIESTFTSAADLGSELYPFLPVRWIITYELNTLGYLKENSVPVLIVHSEDDQLIPFHHGKELFREVSGPKTFVKLRGGHGGAHIESEEIYLEAVRKFINEISN